MSGIAAGVPYPIAFSGVHPPVRVERHREGASLKAGMASSVIERLCYMVGGWNKLDLAIGWISKNAERWT